MIIVLVLALALVNGEEYALRPTKIIMEKASNSVYQVSSPQN